MKVLLAGSRLGYNLEHYLETAMKKEGHDVTFYGWNSQMGALASTTRILGTRYHWFRVTFANPLLRKINKELIHQVEELQPDLFFSVKGEAILPRTVDTIGTELGVKTALWFPDDPRYFDSLVKYIAPHYQYVFTSSERSVDTYREIGVRSIQFLPFACDPSVHSKTSLTESETRSLQSDVCFVGTYSRRRARILKRLRGFRLGLWGAYWEYSGLWRETRGRATGPQMVKVLNASKIVLNIHDEQDLNFKTNMRVFEATGSGAFLLTDRAYGIDKMYVPTEEIACFDDDADLPKVVQHYLDNPKLIKDVPLKGQVRAYRDHTYEKRAESLFQTIQ